MMEGIKRVGRASVTSHLDARAVREHVAQREPLAKMPDVAEHPRYVAHLERL